VSIYVGSLKGRPGLTPEYLKKNSLLFGLSAMPCLVSAQEVPTARPNSHWYVGLQAAYQHYPQPETVHGGGLNSTYSLLPGQFSVGYSFNSRISVEAGLLVRNRLGAVTVETTQDPTSRYRYYETNSDAHPVAIPLLVRWQLHPSAARLQVGTIIGLTFVQGTFQQVSRTTIENNPLSETAAEYRRIGDLPVLLGLGAQYRLRPHWQLTADANANISWIESFARALGSKAAIVGGGGAAGLRYSF